MGNNLEKIRGKHQVNITTLANELGVTKQAISLNEKVRISLPIAKKVAAYFNENIFDVMGSDVLLVLPKNEEDKQILIDMIKEL